MKTVYKYGLNIHHINPDSGYASIELPMGAEIVHLAPDPYDAAGIFVWAIVQPSNPIETREFVIIGTGHPLPQGKNLSFVGTAVAMQGSLVWHVFEVVKP